MNTSEQIDKIMPALHAARKAMTPAAKGGVNRFDRYAYATEFDWHSAIMPELLANHLVLLFSVGEPMHLGDRPTKAGGVEFAYRVQVKARLIHTSGQWIETIAYGDGQDRGDKGLYKAITGAKKYGYATLFALPTTDDPEEDNRTSEVQQPATIGKQETKAKPPEITEKDWSSQYRDFRAWIEKDVPAEHVRDLINAMLDRHVFSGVREMVTCTDGQRFDKARTVVEEIAVERGLMVTPF